MEERSGETKIEKRKKGGGEKKKKNTDNKTSFISELVARRKTILRGRVRSWLRYKHNTVLTLNGSYEENGRVRIDKSIQI